jgi:hypothetical protein
MEEAVPRKDEARQNVPLAHFADFLYDRAFIVGKLGGGRE